MISSGSPPEDVVVAAEPPSIPAAPPACGSSIPSINQPTRHIHSRVEIPAMSASKRRKPTATEPCLALSHEHERSRNTHQTVRHRQLSSQRHRITERRHDMRVRQQTFERSSELLRGCRAWEIRLRQHHLIDKARERFDKASMILVAHHPKDKDHGAEWMRSVRVHEVVGQSRCGSRIMRAIQQDRRTAIDHFQSSGPVDRTQARSHRLSRDSNPLRGRRPQQRQRTGSVIKLVATLQGTSQSVILHTQTAIGKLLGPLSLCAKILIQTKHRGLPFPCHLFDRPPRVIFEPPQYHRHPWFYNAGLLERDR